MQNLTGVQAIFGDMNLAGNTMQQLTEEEQAARKKKLLAAGTTDSFSNAITAMFGDRLSSAGGPRV